MALDNTLFAGRRQGSVEVTGCSKEECRHKTRNPRESHTKAATCDASLEHIWMVVQEARDFFFIKG